MRSRNLVLFTISLIVLTSVVVYSADAAGIPKKAISTVARFLESDLPTTSVFTDQASTYTAGKQTFVASSSSGAGVNIPTGSDPTTPAQGDIWLNSDTLKYRGTSTHSLITSAVTSINSDTTAAQLIQGVSGNTSASTSAGTTTINTGSNVVVTGGSAQTITKSVTVNSLTLGGDMDVGNNGLTNTGHKSTLPSNTGTLLQSNGTLTGTLSGGTITGTITGSPTTTGTWTNTGIFDFGSTGTLKIGNNDLLIRNPASSFAYTLTGSAITANRTLTLPVITQTETIAVNPQTNFTKGHTGGNVTKTTSTTITMSGNYATITPSVTGNVRVIVTGYMTQATSGDGCRIDVRQSTSNLGATGAAVSGTLVGQPVRMTVSTANGNATLSKVVVATGLTVGTKQFFDLSYATVVGGTCTLKNIDWLLQEY